MAAVPVLVNLGLALMAAGMSIIIVALALWAIIIWRTT